MESRTEPFRHWVADDWAEPALVRAADAEWPDARWLHWHRYDSAESKKLATKDPLRIPPASAELLRQLACMPVAAITGLADVFPDLLLHGGGMHALESGGRLGVHLDGDRHPQTGWRRRLSAMLYVNERWHAGWGGALELWDEKAQACVASIEPRFNRLVIFECGPAAYHGVPRPVRCPVGEQRRSLALFYWSAADGGGTRDRASFVASAQSPPTCTSDCKTPDQTKTCPPTSTVAISGGVSQQHGAGSVSQQHGAGTFEEEHSNMPGSLPTAGCRKKA
jgi:hypothetical protein